jgi:tetratricopeptide (TPR) repeat protein
MNSRRPSALLFAGLLLMFTIPSRGEAPPSIMVSYASSPARAHQALREAFRRGEPVRDAIEAVERAAGDYSFEALKFSSPERILALRIQSEALREWEGGRKEEAVRLYEDARRLLEEDGALTEAAFCRYLQAEILAEDERLVEGLRLLDEAFELIEGRRYLYIEALIHQSRGYILWYLDKLAQGVAAFYGALEIWTRISFGDGEVSSWNNLAALYEELDLPHRAGDCYMEALSRVNRGTGAEIRYQLMLNVALFLKDEGDTDRGLRFLDLARPYLELAPDDFALAEAELLGAPEPILDLAPRGVAVEVRRRILLGEKLERIGDGPGAAGHLQKAVELSGASGQRLLARRAALALGRLLESKGHFEEAGRLYRESLDREELVLNVDAAFPFWRAVSPLFDGWVRCLVRSGRTDEARLAIRSRTLLRLKKIEVLLDSGVGVSPPGNGLDELGSLISLIEARVPVHADPFVPGRSPTDSFRPDREDRSWAPIPGTAVVELWPDRSALFAWIEIQGKVRFLELPAGEDLLRLVRTVAEPLYSTDRALPPAPPAAALGRLSAWVLHPIESWLSGSRLLLIPYKEFQALPFELLELRDGQRLGERYMTSYLPVPDRRFAATAAVAGPPLLMTSGELLIREGAKRERRYFESLRPAPRVVAHAAQLPPVVRGSWIHVSAHLRLHPRSWLFSLLGDRNRGLTLGELMNRRLETELLSLAVCDGANSYSAGFPYWLGTAEIFLLQGAQSLVLSRWAVDERSAALFVDLYRELARGRPIDEALFRARRKFLSAARRGSEPTDHPFFWAGVLYAGAPGKKLALPIRDARAPPAAAAAAAVVAFVLAAGTLIRRLGTAGAPTTLSTPIPPSDLRFGKSPPQEQVDAVAGAHLANNLPTRGQEIGRRPPGNLEDHLRFGAHGGGAGGPLQQLAVARELIGGIQEHKVQPQIFGGISQQNESVPLEHRDRSLVRNTHSMEVLPEEFDRLGIPVVEDHPGRATTQGLQSHGARSGEQVEPDRPLDAVSQDVEQGLP